MIQKPFRTKPDLNSHLQTSRFPPSPLTVFALVVVVGAAAGRVVRVGVGVAALAVAVALLLALPGAVAAVLALPVGLLALVGGVAGAVRGLLAAAVLLLLPAVLGRRGGRVPVPALVVGAVSRGAAAAARVGVAAVAVELAWTERGGSAFPGGGRRGCSCWDFSPSGAGWAGGGEGDEVLRGRG